MFKLRMVIFSRQNDNLLQNCTNNQICIYLIKYCQTILWVRSILGAVVSHFNHMSFSSLYCVVALSYILLGILVMALIYKLVIFLDNSIIRFSCPLDMFFYYESLKRYYEVGTLQKYVIIKTPNIINTLSLNTRGWDALR